jgi:hypothetical protein
MGGGAMGGGGMAGSGRQRRGGGAGSGSGSGAPGPRSADLARLTDQRQAEVKDALARAFAILDPEQRDAATRLLAAHDVDTESGSTAASPSAPTSEPEPGQEP